MTDYVTRNSPSGAKFIPKLFQGFPEIKEALISNRMQAGFLVAPMALALRSQGVPVKIVYLGHRFGSSVVVRKDGPIHSVLDLKGRTLAIPSRFSDERLVVSRALEMNGASEKDLKLVEMPAPEMPAALNAGAIDAFSVAEPFPSQAQLGGYGRILFDAREYWPDYISCVLVVRDDLIEGRPEVVQMLVDGMARTGAWLDGPPPAREYAAEFVGRYYYNQPVDLLRFALTQPRDRVLYSNLTPLQTDFELVHRLMRQHGLLERPLAFEEYTDVRFAEKAVGLPAWEPAGL